MRVFHAVQGCRRRSDLKEASGAGRSASRGVDGLHPCELLGKVPHVQLALQLRLERSRHLLLRQVVPVQALLVGEERERGEPGVGGDGQSYSRKRSRGEGGGATLKKGCALMSSEPRGPEPSRR